MIMDGLSINYSWRHVLERNHFDIAKYFLHGEIGFGLVIKRHSDKGSIIITETDWPEEPGVFWIHASMSFVNRVPTYDEMVILHRAFFGRRRWSYQVFAPEDEHINIHANALHLWGRSDGKSVFDWEQHIKEIGSV